MIVLRNIFLIELKKIFSQKKTYIIWIIFILMLIFNYKVNMIQTDHFISSTLNTENSNFMNSYNSAKSGLEGIKYTLEDKNTSPGEKKEYEKYLKNKQEQMNNYDILLDKNSNEMDKIKAKINILKSEMKEISYGKLNTSFDLNRYKSELRFLTYLEQNKIPEEIGKQNSFTFMLNFFASTFTVGAIFLIALFSSDIFTKEYEDSTIKLMLVQPISRKKVLLGKYLSLICSIIIIVLSTMLIGFIIVGIKDGFGNPNYPYIYNMTYIRNNTSNILEYVINSGIYISAVSMIIRQLMFFILLLITVASISFTISELSTTSTISTTIGVILNMFLIYYVFGTKGMRGVTKYTYVTYSKVFSLFSGNLKQTLNNNGISPLSGIVLMVVLNIGCCVVSSIFFSRKEI